MCNRIDILLPSHYCIDSNASDLFQGPVGIWSNATNASVRDPDDIQEILNILKIQNYITPECPHCRKKFRLGKI